jgi:peptidyl-tRNA hydrolase
MVFAVRTDLKMKTGKIAAQVAHAAVEAARTAESEEPQLLQLWESHGCAKVCLKVITPCVVSARARARVSAACVRARLFAARSCDAGSARAGAPRPRGSPAVRAYTHTHIQTHGKLPPSSHTRPPSPHIPAPSARLA